MTAFLITWRLQTLIVSTNPSSASRCAAPRGERSFGNGSAYSCLGSNKCPVLVGKPSGSRELMLSLNKMHDVVQQLAKIRPVFHSEFDFQHALAWQIHTSLPNASMRLQLPVRTATDNIYLDLLVRCEDSISYPIELKYKTDLMTSEVNGEQFSLRRHTDAGLHDFWKDVTRLERYIATEERSIGYAIFLSNDPFYWEPGLADKRDVGEFSMCENRVVRAGEEMRSGPRRRIQQSITCQFGYKCSWTDYSRVTATPTTRGHFRYLLLAIQKP